MRPATLLLLLALAALTVLTPATASADSLICPKGVVSTGDRKLEVLQKCGEPELVDIRYEGSYYAEKVEDWYYTIKRWPRVFVFRNGVLAEIILQP